MKKNILLLLLLAVMPNAFPHRAPTPEMQFKNDAANSTIRIHILGGIAARPQKGDAEFQKEYGVRFHDFGCLAPANLSFYTDYNLLAFAHLQKLHGTVWEETIRKDVLGWNKWRPNTGAVEKPSGSPLVPKSNFTADRTRNVVQEEKIQSINCRVIGPVTFGEGPPGGEANSNPTPVSTIPSDILYVIDGVPQKADVFMKIKSEDILSISVLKDSGTFISCRNPSGVIIIKTKNGLTNREIRKMKRDRKKSEKAKK